MFTRTMLTRTWLRRRALPVSLLAVLLPAVPALAAHHGPPKPPPLPANASDAIRGLQKTADGAVRAFLVSMISPDPGTLQQVILPVPPDDFAYLVAHHPVSGKARDVVVARIASMPLQPLAVGDSIALPGGRKFTVRKGDVTADHALLQVPGGPLPVLVQRVKGLWYVDARPIIAARREAAKDQAELRKKLAAKAAKAAKSAKPAKPSGTRPSGSKSH